MGCHERGGTLAPTHLLVFLQCFVSPTQAPGSVPRCWARESWQPPEKSTQLQRRPQCWGRGSPRGGRPLLWSRVKAQRGLQAPAPSGHAQRWRQLCPHLAGHLSAAVIAPHRAACRCLLSVPEPGPRPRGALPHPEGAEVICAFVRGSDGKGEAFASRLCPSYVAAEASHSGAFSMVAGPRTPHVQEGLPQAGWGKPLSSCLSDDIRMWGP